MPGPSVGTTGASSFDSMWHQSMLDIVNSTTTVDLSTFGYTEDEDQPFPEEEVKEEVNEFGYLNDRLVTRKNSFTGNIDSIKQSEANYLPQYYGYNKGNCTTIKREIVDVEQCYCFPGLGLFLKTEPDLQYDKFQGVYFYKDMHKHYKIRTIFQNFDEKGFSNPDYFIVYNCEFFDYSQLRSIYAYVDSIIINTNILNNKLFRAVYKEDLNKGTFIMSDKDIPLNRGKKYCGIEYKMPLNRFEKAIKDKPLTYIKTLGKKYRFGVEIETSSGILPTYLTKDLYYSSVYDGSLKDSEGNVYGYEYVTDILKGDLGLKQLKMLSNEIRKRCLIDQKCSVHTHISDVTFNKENIVLLYSLCQILEAEIFSSLPYSRRNNEYCRVMRRLNIDKNFILTNRDYAINTYYNDIVSVLSTKGPAGAHINKKTQHPKGHKCGYDHSTERYCWINFIPAVFNTRHNGEYSIEFRCLGGTSNYYDIKNWLLICMAIISLVEDYKKFIYYSTEPITIENILKTVYYNNYHEILAWFNNQKEKFKDPIIGRENELTGFQDYTIDNNFNIKSL